MKTLTPRLAFKRAQTILKDTPVLGLVGPRQSGKTTLAQSLGENSRRYVTLDDPNQLQAARFDPVRFIRELDVATIDEIQRAPDLMLAIKQSIDRDRRPGRFIVTGSANLFTSDLLQESMAGRIETLQIYPFSQDELREKGPCNFIDRAFDNDLFHTNQSDAVNIEQLVLQGGYPEALARTDHRRRRDWHGAYIKSIVQKDLPEISNIERHADMPRFVQLLALLNGQLINPSELGFKLAMDRKTAARYTELLEQLFIVQSLPAWANSPLKSLVKKPKLHFLDSGLAAHLQGVTSLQLEKNRTPLGNLLETFILNELTKQSSWADGRYYFSHYREKSGYEVDIVIENDQREVMGIEAKASATVNEADFKGLQKLKEGAKNFKRGILFYDGDLALPFGPHFQALPFSTLWSR